MLHENVRLVFAILVKINPVVLFFYCEPAGDSSKATLVSRAPGWRALVQVVRSWTDDGLKKNRQVKRCYSTEFLYAAAQLLISFCLLWWKWVCLPSRVPLTSLHCVHSFAVRFPLTLSFIDRMRERQEIRAWPWCSLWNQKHLWK